MDSSWPYIPVKVADLGAVKEGDALIITVSKADNSINTGWQWGPQVFVNLDYNNFLPTKSLENGATNVEVKYSYSAEDAAKILAGNELEIQGMNVVITKIESLINEAVEYEETGTTLEMDQYGQVYKDQLADFSGRDKLVFNYKKVAPTTKRAAQHRVSLAGALAASRALEVMLRCHNCQ